MRWLLFLAGLALGVGAGALKWRGSAEHFHRQARMAVILDQARQMPPGGVLVIGDSIAERNRFDTLCGRPALNAGISWSKPSDWLDDAPKVVAAAKPSIVVLALGTNGMKDYEKLVPLADFAVRPNGVSVPIRSVPGPTSLQDGIHPDAKGAEQFRQAIELGCRQSPSAAM